jgi:hypothetical protein
MGNIGWGNRAWDAAASSAAISGLLQVIEKTIGGCGSRILY